MPSDNLFALQLQSNMDVSTSRNIPLMHVKEDSQLRQRIISDGIAALCIKIWQAIPV